MSDSYRILYHHRIRAEDGQASHVRELIGAMREEGHEVEECALVPKAEPIATDSGMNGRTETARATDSAAQPRASLLWSRVSLPRLATETMEVAYNRTGIRLLRNAVRRRRPDFLYERHALHLHAGLTVAREAGIPLLLEVNSPMCDEMTRLELLRFPRRARDVERRVLSGANRVFPVTGVLRDWLIGCGAAPEACRVIGNAAVPERYDAAAHQGGADLRAELGFGPGDFVVGFVGFMRDWHRLEFAVDALVRPELASMRLLLVGDGPALAETLARADHKGVADRVHCIGVVPPADVPRHVCAFDVGIVPAINPYSSPLKLFDYFAAGVPCLAADQPNVMEIVEHGKNGSLYPAGQGDAFADRLCEWARDREGARKIGAAARDHMLESDWTWRGNARRVIAAFEEVRRQLA